MLKSALKLILPSFLLLFISNKPLSAAQVSNLVAAYSFNEGTGSTLNDTSGNSNNGVLTNGPAWVTTGKYGKALNFDGSNDLVVVPDSNSLDLVNGMTVEAWVYPTTNMFGYDAVVMKGRSSNLSYALFANSFANKPTANFYQGTTSVLTSGGTKLTANTWAHVAMTYDGTTLKLYKNGSLLSSTTKTGGITTSSNSLTIGGSMLFTNQDFAGRIDEVRIYNRALTSTEITNDMNTPISVTPTSSPTPTLTRTSTATPLPTSTPTPPPTFTPTPLPTLTLTQTTSPTPTSGVILTDLNNETGDFSQYTFTATGSGDLSISGNAALGGTNFGMSVLVDDTNLDYGYKTIATPSTTGVIRARFYIDPNGLSMTDLSQISAIYFINSGGASNFASMKLMKISGGYYLRGVMVDDNGIHQETAAWPITDAPHFAEIRVKRATSATANDATYETWIDGVAQATMTGVDSYDKFIDFQIVSVGKNGMAGTISGTFYLDEVVVNDSGSVIGPTTMQTSPTPSPTFTPTPTPSASPTQQAPTGLVGIWKMNEASWNGLANQVLDSSGNSLHGTSSGNATTVLGKYGNGGILDGLGDFVTVSRNALLEATSLTLSIWVKSSDPTPGPALAYIVDKFRTEFDADSYYLYADGSNNLRFTVRLAGGGCSTPSGVNNLWDNNWHYITATYNGTATTLYVDGVQRSQNTACAGTIQYLTTGNLTIGNRSTLINYYNGLLDEMRIYNRVLSTTEIQQDMSTP